MNSSENSLGPSSLSPINTHFDGLLANSIPEISRCPTVILPTLALIAHRLHFSESTHDFIDSHGPAGRIRVKALLKQAVHPLGSASLTKRLAPALMEIKPIGRIQFGRIGHLESGPKDHRRDRCGKAEDIGPRGSKTTQELFRARITRVTPAAGEGRARLRGLRKPDHPGRAIIAYQNVPWADGAVHEALLVNVRQRLADSLHQPENRVDARHVPAIEGRPIDILLKKSDFMHSEAFSPPTQLTNPTNASMLQPLADLVFSSETRAAFFILGGMPLDILECLEGCIHRIRDQIGRD
jgi:hypothetical protein